MSDLAERITNHLTNGGLFNPELMEADKIRDLLIDCRTAISECDRRIEEQKASWETTANVLCERLGIERKADAHHIVTAINALRAECEGLRAALERLVSAKALSGVRALVAGWNGEDKPKDQRYGKHPSRLGARIETNCGRIYELDEIMQDARATLSQPAKEANSHD